MLNQISKELSRSQLHEIWLLAKSGEPFDDEEKGRIAKAMLEHTEYHHIWDKLDHIKDSEIVENGVHTTLHITMHTVVENQLAQNTPPEVQKALDSLVKHGTSRHEAIHAIANEFARELFPVLKTMQPFNNMKYKRRLEKIAREK
jgi:predicted secreted Zn-dependent protease